MPVSVESWPCLGHVVRSPPEPVEGQMSQTGQKSGCGLEADVSSSQSDVILHSHSFKISPNLEEGSPLPHQLKLPTIAQDNACRNVSRQIASPSQHTIWPSGSDDKELVAGPKRHHEMSHGQNKKKKASDFDKQNVFHLPRAATSVRHGSRSPKPSTVQPRLVMPPSQQLDAVDGEFDDDKLDLYNNEEEHLKQDPQRQRDLKRNRIAAKKCRGRKCDEGAALAAREHDVEIQYRYLSKCYDSLTTEVYLLKSELLRHTSCNCTLIQNDINSGARKSVESMNPSPHTIQTDNQTTPTHLDYATRASSYFDSEILKLEGQMNTNTERPETQLSGSPKACAVKLADDNQVACHDAFNHWHNHIHDDTTKLSRNYSHTHQRPAESYDHTSIYLAGYNDRANDQALGYSFNPPLGFEPSFMELNDGSVQISSSYS